jgi:hypothetical protein
VPQIYEKKYDLINKPGVFSVGLYAYKKSYFKGVSLTKSLILEGVSLTKSLILAYEKSYFSLRKVLF